MKKFLFFAFFLVGIVCKAQIKNLSIHAGANYPLINNIESRNVATIPIASATGYSFTTIGIGVKESFSGKVGFQIGGSFDYPVAKKIFISSGLTLSYLQYKRSVKVTDVPAGIEQLTTLFPVVAVGQPFGTFYGIPASSNGGTVLNPPNLFKKSDKYGNTTALSVQVPVLAGTSFINDRLQVKTGAVFSYLISSTEVKTKYTAATNSISEYKDSSKAPCNEFQAGIAFETSYLIGKKIEIDLTAQKFFTSIYKDNPKGGEAKYNVLSLGLGYVL